MRRGRVNWRHHQCWKLGITRKKSTFYKEQDPEKIAAYLEEIKDIPKEKLIYVDKAGIETQMFRQYARSNRSQWLNMRISGKRRARIGLVAAQCTGKLIAPFTYGGTMKAPLFEPWYKDELLKALPGSYRLCCLPVCPALSLLFYPALQNLLRVFSFRPQRR